MTNAQAACVHTAASDAPLIGRQKAPPPAAKASVELPLVDWLTRLQTTEPSLMSSLSSMIDCATCTTSVSRNWRSQTTYCQYGACGAKRSVKKERRRSSRACVRLAKRPKLRPVMSARMLSAYLPRSISCTAKRIEASTTPTWATTMLEVPCSHKSKTIRQFSVNVSVKRTVSAISRVSTRASVCCCRLAGEHALSADCSPLTPSTSSISSPMRKKVNT
eukprot:scaffold98927_cov60-Phaeocystis_antarctica.AAC.3